MRSLSAGAARWVASASYLKKWIVLGVIIGAVAGCGAIVFYEALVASTHFFLGVLAGYHVPTPIGEGGHAASASAARPWALPLVAGAGALLGAVLVFRIAPEAEGHGTDAAISAVHHNPRGVRFRAVIVKIVASALTIGSGGSGGREGPTGQISAGFGSLLARVLDLEPADGRIAVATGIGSGIGAIFGAPLGGAVLASEILYRDDFEPAALLPCFIASAVSYVIFGAAEGYKPLFGFVGSYHFSDPSQLIWFALIGILAGLVGLLYAKSFYGLVDLFHRSPLPRWVNPAIGGLLVGAIGIAIPEVIGTGYGWVQTSLGHGLLSIPLWIVLLLPFARIFATGLSIGSGGSGGIFGPGMVIGAFLGASVWRLFEPVFPSMGHSPAPYVIVGMMACFGGISRAPLAVMLMVAEMTGSLSILTPAMVAVGISWLIVRRNDDTIYRSQLKSRADAPAQRILAGLPLLGAIPTTRAMVTPRLIISSDMTTTSAKTALEQRQPQRCSCRRRSQALCRYRGTFSAQLFSCGSKNGERPRRCRRASRLCIESARRGPGELDGSTTVLGPRTRRRPASRRHPFRLGHRARLPSRTGRKRGTDEWTRRDVRRFARNHQWRLSHLRQNVAAGRAPQRPPRHLGHTRGSSIRPQWRHRIGRGRPTLRSWSNRRLTRCRPS